MCLTNRKRAIVLIDKFDKTLEYDGNITDINIYDSYSVIPISNEQQNINPPPVQKRLWTSRNFTYIIGGKSISIPFILEYTALIVIRSRQILQKCVIEKVLL